MPEPDATQPLPVQPPAAPAQKRRRTNKAVLIGSAAALLSLCACGGITIAFSANKLQAEPGPTASAGQAWVEPTSAGPSTAEPPTIGPSTAEPPTSAPPQPTTAKTTQAPAPRTTTKPPTAKPTPTATKTTPAVTPPAIRQDVHKGALCSPAGALGVTSTGKPMVCTSTPADPSNRWRAA